MIVTCSECGKRYDDVYRWTYCPHEYFEMNTVVVGSDGKERVAHTVEDLRHMMKETHENPERS